MHLCEEEDPCAKNRGLWKTQRCTTQIPLPEKNTSQLHESGLCTAPAISFFEAASAVQLGLPILGITPGKSLSNIKLRAHSSWKDPQSMTIKKSYSSSHYTTFFSLFLLFFSIFSFSFSSPPPSSNHLNFFK